MHEIRLKKSPEDKNKLHEQVAHIFMNSSSATMLLSQSVLMTSYGVPYDQLIEEGKVGSSLQIFLTKNSRSTEVFKWDFIKF